MEEIDSSDIWFGFIIHFDSLCIYLYGSNDFFVFQEGESTNVVVILGFAAGIMLYTAFMKLMPDAVHILSGQLPYREVKLITTSYFFLGIFLLYPLGYLVNIWKKRENDKYDESTRHYRRIAILILITITAHSFVEGLATFLSYLATPLVAIPLVMSIIVHNFPEGMTIGCFV